MGAGGRRGLLTGGAVAPLSNGSAFNFQCNTLTGYTATSNGNSVASQTTVDSRSVFDLYSGATYDAANQATVTGTGKFTPVSSARAVISILSRVDQFGTLVAATPVTQYIIGYGSADRRFTINLYSDGFKVQNAAGAFINFSAPYVFDEWLWLTVDINQTTDLCDIWYGDTKVGTGIDCAYAGLVNGGRVTTAHFNRTVSGFIESTHDIDRILVGDGVVI